MSHFLSFLVAFFISQTLAQDDLDLIPCMGKGRGRNSTALRAQFDEQILPRGRLGVRSKVYEVETYVHVITTSEKKDWYPNSMVQKQVCRACQFAVTLPLDSTSQIEVMNTAYAGSFNFELKSVDYTIHDVWATQNTDENEAAYKTILSQGSYADLNLYFLSDLGKAENSTLLGFCYMPESDPDSQELLLNGCTNLAATMPGGESARFGMGMTSVHEVGHVRWRNPASIRQ